MVNTNFSSKGLTVSDELYRRVEDLEHSHRDIVKELKESNRTTNDSINKLTNDVNILVTNVGHLTKSIEEMSRVIDRTHQIEIDLVTVKNRTDTIAKLWTKVDELNDKVAAQSPVSNAVKIIGTTLLASAVGLIASIVSTGGFGG